jgi:CRP-like cAMP-binding protein
MVLLLFAMKPASATDDAMNETLPREQFAPAEIVFGIGEPGDSAYVIESGSVEILALPDRAAYCCSGCRGIVR